MNQYLIRIPHSMYCCICTSLIYVIAYLITIRFLKIGKHIISRMGGIDFNIMCLLPILLKTVKMS